MFQWKYYTVAVPNLSTGLLLTGGKAYSVVLFLRGFCWQFRPPPLPCWFMPCATRIGVNTLVLACGQEWHGGEIAWWRCGQLGHSSDEMANNARVRGCIVLLAIEQSTMATRVPLCYRVSMLLLSGWLSLFLAVCLAPICWWGSVPGGRGSAKDNIHSVSFSASVSVSVSVALKSSDQNPTQLPLNSHSVPIPISTAREVSPSYQSLYQWPYYHTLVHIESIYLSIYLSIYHHIHHHIYHQGHCTLYQSMFQSILFSLCHSLNWSYQLHCLSIYPSWFDSKNILTINQISFIDSSFNMNQSINWSIDQLINFLNKLLLYQSIRLELKLNSIKEED